MYCSYCGSKKHNYNTCPKTWNSHYKYCGYCGKADHSEENCPGKWGNIRAREIKKLKERGLFDGDDLCD